MTAVKFSVVIPTRERAETLRYALQTCLDQQFDDYEVIVSDNFSSPATRAVVDEAATPRVRYVRTPRPLAMSSNWDFGLAHARGEYVLLIGDDDGLLPHALAELDRLTRDHPGRVIRWEPVYYTWPSFALPQFANYLRVPLLRGLSEHDGLRRVQAVAGFCLPYSALPMFYNAVVPRGVIERLKARTGRVFPHPIPDVYSGFAVAAVAGSYLSSDLPMTVAGQSGASNGIATLFHRGRNPIDREFRELNAQEQLPTDPRVPDLPAFPHVPVAQAFLFAKSQFFPDAPIELDRREFVRGTVANLRVADEAQWQAALRQLRDSLADVPHLQVWFDAEFARQPYHEPPPPPLRPDYLGFDGEYLHLDATRFGIGTVAEAAELCEQLLNCRQHGARFTSPLVDELRQALAERSSVIADLKRECEARLAKIHELDARLRRALRGGPLKRLARWIKHRIEAHLGRPLRLG